jgi:tetratricopeptide (TPR) repeat protein
MASLLMEFEVMEKVGRNAPCPCGSGKKYKKCCLPLHQQSSPQEFSPGPVTLVPGFTELDSLSNRVVDLIEEGRMEEAENVCHQLLARYPDQIDGTERLAEVYEAKGEKKRAAEYYRKAAEFAEKSPGFDQELIDRYFSQAKLLESQE